MRHIGIYNHPYLNEQYFNGVMRLPPRAHFVCVPGHQIKSQSAAVHKNVSERQLVLLTKKKTTNQQQNVTQIAAVWGNVWRIIKTDYLPPSNANANYKQNLWEILAIVLNARCIKVRVCELCVLLLACDPS